MYFQVLTLFNILVGCSKFLSKYCWYCQVSSGIARYCEGSKKNLDNLVPNSDFCLDIRLAVSAIGSDQIRLDWKVYV